MNTIDIHLRAARPLDRIFNDPDQIVEDGIRGYLLAHPDILTGTKTRGSCAVRIKVPHARLA
ncbi:hypothetical protein RAA17_16065 [Komagataeibacter rhaeticus]|nr:hypothetical protein [Komagataeibacter rhaeticus]